jgi:excinuclease ABC subunit C
MTPRAPAAVAALPGTPGVYRFRGSGGRVLYIGRASALRSRVASYWWDLGDRAHLAAMVARVTRIEAASCDSPHEAAWLERNLLETSMPAWNRTAGGQESTVYIRLDGRPAGMGLTVEHLPRPAARLRYFGPYLGGLRVRQAVAGLDRILPLGYAGSRLRGARLDLARARGHGDADPDALIRGITAVLDRQADAVAWAGRELDRLRDRAAGMLAFELAARIHAERQALDWVTSPQRVTTMAADDLDVYGWAGGVLVHFAVRGGRLREWSQRRCGRDRADPRLAATPACWAGFARRNAELAAGLATGGVTPPG